MPRENYPARVWNGDAAEVHGEAMAEAMVALTPRQRFLQAEPSWFFSGHTTSLVASETEKELVREDLGGIPRW
jgi:hypothetical protein